MSLGVLARLRWKATQMIQLVENTVALKSKLTPKSNTHTSAASCSWPHAVGWNLQWDFSTRSRLARPTQFPQQVEELHTLHRQSWMRCNHNHVKITFAVFLSLDFMECKESLDSILAAYNINQHQSPRRHKKASMSHERKKANTGVRKNWIGILFTPFRHEP